MDNFAKLITQLITELESVVGYVDEKEIQYGKQLVFNFSEEKFVLSIHNGKKGIKPVLNGTSSLTRDKIVNLIEKVFLDNNLKVSIAGTETAKKEVSQSLFTETTKSTTNVILSTEKDFDYKWIGSDESGKGDFFGPLVVASVYVDKDSYNLLIEEGIKDCKEVSDKKISVLADKIRKIAPVHAVLVMKPEAYNKRYEELVAKDENLNHLLGYGHIVAISKLMEQEPDCKWAIIDQFTTSNRVLSALQAKFPNLKAKQQPKAEEDVAVAAASILAREAFLNTMEELAKLANVPELPKGGSDIATSIAEKIAKKEGKEYLRKLVKMHFKNYSRIE